MGGDVYRTADGEASGRSASPFGVPRRRESRCCSPPPLLRDRFEIGAFSFSAERTNFSTSPAAIDDVSTRRRQFICKISAIFRDARVSLCLPIGNPFLALSILLPRRTPLSLGNDSGIAIESRSDYRSG